MLVGWGIFSIGRLLLVDDQKVKKQKPINIIHMKENV
jgi:hypothetical protein